MPLHVSSTCVCVWCGVCVCVWCVCMLCVCGVCGVCVWCVVCVCGVCVCGLVCVCVCVCVVCVVCVVQKGEKRNAYRFLMMGKRERLRLRCEDNIKMASVDWN